MVATASPPRRSTLTGHGPLAGGLAVVGIAVALVAARAALIAQVNRPATAVTLLHVAAGVMFVIVGAVAAVRRPRNRTGLLMIAVGITWFLTDLQFLPWSPAFTAGDLLGVLCFAVLGHLVVAFPSGRLSGRMDHVIVTAGYIWSVAGNLLSESLYAPDGVTAPVHNLAVLHRDGHFNQLAGTAQQIGNIVLGALTAALVAVHWARASPPSRRALSPALWASGPILAIVVGLNIAGVVASPDWLQASLPALTPVAVLTLPLAFLFGMVRSRLARLAVGHLVVELRASPPPNRLRDVLARALGDPSLTLAYRVAATSEWVDADGAAVSLPPAGSSRSHTILEREGETVAALVHDRSLDDDPVLVGSVAAAAALALENERLSAEVRARLAEVRASRARIVEAGDRERRRLERNLHDGAQQRLVALGMRLGRLRDEAGTTSTETVRAGLAEACDQLRAAVAELRELAGGIHPAILAEAGLGPALQSLAEGAANPVRIVTTPDRRLPDAVEAAAWFVVSECLANVAKHGGPEATATVAARCEGHRLTVTIEDDGRGGVDLSRGTGLAGLVDRCEALNGTLNVESPEHGGTRVVAELPCD